VKLCLIEFHKTSKTKFKSYLYSHFDVTNQCEIFHDVRVSWIYIYYYFFSCHVYYAAILCYFN